MIGVLKTKDKEIVLDGFIDEDIMEFGNKKVSIMETEIGGIHNEYGGLSVKEDNNKYYWSIENYDGFKWEEIPKYLYDSLLKFNNETK